MSDLPLFNSEKAGKFSSEEVLEQLKSSLAGLSDREAKERLARFGPNAIEGKQIHPLVKAQAYRLISHAGRHERKHLDRVHLSLYTYKQ